MERYQPLINKTHEIQILHLRQERKTESLRLDNLKKGLQQQLTTRVIHRDTEAVPPHAIASEMKG
ncbi:MAG: hypothetical protein WB421_04520 [Terriglobales bacterium]